MMESRYSKCFADLDRRGEGAFVPFVVLGDPDPDTSLALLRTFAAKGADMLELGIPFSDPVADGKAIQAADLRALNASTTPGVALEILTTFRSEYPDIPIGLLLYANLAQRPGPLAFYRRLAAAGVDSVLIADLPIEEAGPFLSAARATGVGQVFMVTPVTNATRMRQALSAGGPYLYVVSRTGVTGRDSKLSTTAGPLLRRIRKEGDARTLLGFGIGKPEQVAEAIAAGASGAISGSAVTEIIASFCDKGGHLDPSRRNRLLEESGRFIKSMKRGTRSR
jgi:tryptophan synthase alpha chain